jgi:hypothetical protein
MKLEADFSSPKSPKQPFKIIHNVKREKRLLKRKTSANSEASITKIA